jgi:hypothetical protein
MDTKIPNGHKSAKCTLKIPNGHEFLSPGLRKYNKLAFLVKKYTIWQP